MLPKIVYSPEFEKWWEGAMDDSDLAHKAMAYIGWTEGWHAALTAVSEIFIPAGKDGSGHPLVQSGQLWADAVRGESDE